MARRPMRSVFLTRNLAMTPNPTGPSHRRGRMWMCHDLSEWLLHLAVVGVSAHSGSEQILL